jgi:transcriptional regulator with XRE-family HTH domain
MDNYSIKENIRRIRKARKLTQEEMAHRLGISLTAYRDIEKGSTSMVNSNITRIASHLETSAEELVLGYHPIQMNGQKLEELTGSYTSRISVLEKQVENLEKLVKTLEETIASKNEIIENNKEIISMLRKEK